MKTSTTFSILFWLKLSKVQNGEAPIYARITVNSKRVETTGRHFGKDCNVMGESYYHAMIFFVLLSAVEGSTHATTNLNAQELEERYGNRVRSRMRQLFNLIAFDKESTDKRN